MSYPSDTFSIEMASFAISGNTIDHTWSKFVLRENGYVDPVAKDMLGEIVYWYRPKIERSLDTDQIIIQKKYKSDLLQLSYAQLENRLGYTKRQLEEGFKTLERIGIAERVFRNLVINGQKMVNVLFIRLNQKKLTELRDAELKKCDTSHVKTGHLPHQNVTPLTPKRDTNTESIPDITLEKTAAEENAAAPSVPEEKKTSAIYDCLKNLNIPESDKTEISKYSEQSVQKVVKWATHPLTKINQTLQQAIKWGLKQSPIPDAPKLKEDVTIENRRIASDFKAKAAIPSTMYFEELVDRVEIGYHTAQKEPFELKYLENGFREQLANFLNKNGVKCKK